MLSIPQLSDALPSGKVIATESTPQARTVESGGQIIEIGILSSILILVVQVFSFPFISTTVTVTTLGLLIASEQSNSVWLKKMVSISQLSITLSRTKSGSRVSTKPPDEMLTISSQTISGGILSSITTFAQQVFWLPLLSVTVKNTCAPSSEQLKLVLSISKEAMPQLSDEPSFISSAVMVSPGRTTI